MGSPLRSLVRTKDGTVVSDGTPEGDKALAFLRRIDEELQARGLDPHDVIAALSAAGVAALFDRDELDRFLRLTAREMENPRG